MFACGIRSARERSFEARGETEVGRRRLPPPLVPEPHPLRVPAPEDLNNSRLFKDFSFNNSRPIQGLLPVDHTTLLVLVRFEAFMHDFINNKRANAVHLPA